MMRDMELRNSAFDHHIRRGMDSFNSLQGRIMQDHMRQMNDPVYQMMLQATFESPAVRAIERSFWYYRRVTGVFDRVSIRKAVNQLLERLFPTKFDPESFANHVRAALSAQDNCDGIVKAHSPPIRLIPKTLHPADFVA